MHEFVLMHLCIMNEIIIHVKIPSKQMLSEEGERRGMKAETSKQFLKPMLAHDPKPFYVTRGLQILGG